LQDPNLFWSDPVSAGQPVTEPSAVGVHGLSANSVSVGDGQGAGLVATAVEVGNRVYVVAFRGPTVEDAAALRDRLLLTLDIR
jgi:hypothetical protein